MQELRMRPHDRERPVHTGSGPIALGDGGCCGGQNSSSASANSSGSKGSSSALEGVRADVERLLVLLKLLDLVDDLVPHLPRDYGLTALQIWATGPHCNSSRPSSPSGSATATGPPQRCRC